MLKKIFLFIVIIILVSGCSSKINQNDGKDRIYLNDEFYNKGDFIDIKSNNLDKYEKGNYVLFTYNNYCSLEIPCDKIFEEIMKKYKIDFLSISFEEFKKTEFYNTVKYAPSIIIVKNGEIVTYLNAEEDNDLDKYQDTTAFENWLNNYIYFAK